MFKKIIFAACLLFASALAACAPNGKDTIPEQPIRQTPKVSVSKYYKCGEFLGFSRDGQVVRTYQTALVSPLKESFILRVDNMQNNSWVYTELKQLTNNFFQDDNYSFIPSSGTLAVRGTGKTTSCTVVPSFDINH